MSEPPALWLVPTDPCVDSLYEVEVQVRFKAYGGDIRDVNEKFKVTVEGPVVGDVAVGFPWISEVTATEPQNE